jgi:hypothetical protein
MVQCYLLQEGTGETYDVSVIPRRLNTSASESCINYTVRTEVISHSVKTNFC